MKRLSPAALAAGLLVALLPFNAARATGGEGEAWPSFNESTGCGAAYTRSPQVGRTGGLPVEHLVRGPWGAMFGRTVEQVRDHLVAWDVPGSAERLALHDRLLPALDQVSAALEKTLATGETYRTVPKYSYGFAARTIGGATRMSRHGVGNAMDINANRNPYRDDNVVKTDLPSWWVEAFTAAGLCWGGHWIGKKDTMHFSWQGPAFTAGAVLPYAFPPLTEQVPFEEKAAVRMVVPRPRPQTLLTVLSDGDPNGALDVVHVSTVGSDLVVDMSRAGRRHNACSLRRYVAADAAVPRGDLIAAGFGDWDGRGGQDLWLLEEESGFLELTVRWRFGEFSAETSAITEVPVPAEDAWISTADYNRDGALDLFMVSKGRVQVWSIDPVSGASALLETTQSPLADGATLMLGDHDGDERPDLWALNDDRLQIATARSGYRTVVADDRLEGMPAAVVDAAASDYDGDGRADVVVYDGLFKHVWLGNSRLPDDALLEVWFEIAEPECGENEPRWNELSVLVEADGWVNRGSAMWLTRHDFVAPCDPDAEDATCWQRRTTAGDLVTLLAWMLDLPPAPNAENGFAAAGEALEAAGYDSPCPHSGDVCWSRGVTRAESAARVAMVIVARHGGVPDPHRWVLPTPFPSPHFALNWN